MMDGAFEQPKSDVGEILIVDDNADARALYEALLADDGHAVRTAASGFDALAAVNEREPDLVLLDLSMPGMDGMEVLQRLRARKGGGPAVIVLTAARREADDIERGLRRGADAYLTKPIDGRELRARVRGALDVHRLRRTLEAYRRHQIAMLVHDLRHPLSSLQLVAALLEADDVSDRKHAVETIRRMCRDMSRLVDDVLLASKLEAAVFAVEKARVAVEQVIEPSLSVFRPVAARKQVTLEWTGPRSIVVDCDANKLRQALDNLVANAVKYAAKEGHVRVSAAIDSAHNRVVVEVADDGPGVAESERAQIFELYRQGASGQTSGGTGLGLAIARGIAEAHGGGIEVGDSDLGGAAFRLWVPRGGNSSAPGPAKRG